MVDPRLGYLKQYIINIYIYIYIYEHISLARHLAWLKNNTSDAPWLRLFAWPPW